MVSMQMLGHLPIPDRLDCDPIAGQTRFEELSGLLDQSAMKHLIDPAIDSIAQIVS